MTTSDDHSLSSLRGMGTTNYIDWRNDFSTFKQLLDAKVELGSRNYGDSSFNLPADATVAELQAELLDVCGWGFVLWVRMERLKRRLTELEAMANG